MAKLRSSWAEAEARLRKSQPWRRGVGRGSERRMTRPLAFRHRLGKAMAFSDALAPASCSQENGETTSAGWQGLLTDDGRKRLS